MLKGKALGIGILISIIFAVTAVPTGETNPGGIDPSISTLVEANGCSCHNIGDGDMNKSQRIHGINRNGICPCPCDSRPSSTHASVHDMITAI